MPRATPVAEETLRPLWTCPKCGAGLVTRNLPHACGPYTVEAFLRGRSAHARNLYAGFARLVARCGPVTAAPARTRVAFMARVRFASVSGLARDHITVAFALPRPLESPRVHNVEAYAPGWFHHFVRIREARELDEELLGWLRESYRLMGLQERLRRRPGPRP